jgi:hypothetical protein
MKFLESDDAIAKELLESAVKGEDHYRITDGNKYGSKQISLKVGKALVPVYNDVKVLKEKALERDIKAAKENTKALKAEYAELDEKVRLVSNTIGLISQLNNNVTEYDSLSEQIDENIEKVGL